MGAELPPNERVRRVRVHGFHRGDEPQPRRETGTGGKAPGDARAEGFADA
jgi:hypothetical protein